jgi:AcrR family transcriptional regulator
MPNPLTSQAKRRESYHHGDLRAGLIQAGISQLEQSGPDGLSLRAIAHLTGVSASAPYRHFPNRGKLLEAIAVEGYHRVADLLNRPDVNVGEAAERITTFAKEHPGWWELMVAAPAELGSDLEGARGVFLGELVGIVERHATAADPEEAIRLAVAFWAAVLGLTALRARGGMALLDDTLIPSAKSLAEAVVSGRPLGGAGGRRR